MAEVRLINANALCQHIQDWKTRCKELHRHSVGMYHMMIYEVLCQVLDVINDTPTIDPDDLRGHAKWEKPKELFFIMIDGDGPDDMHEEPAIRCSNCGGMVPQSDFDKWVWNFCPVCGCKMEDATNEQTEIS